MSQTEEQDKSLEGDLSKIEKTDLPNRDFKIMVIKMVTEIREQGINKVRILALRKKYKYKCDFNKCENT